MPLKLLLPICIALGFPCAAHAQYQMHSPMLYEGPRISLQDHADRSGAKPEEAPAPDPDARSFTYRPDAARRRANLAQFVAKSRAVDPAGAGQLEQLFAQGDIIEMMRPELAKHGLNPDNVADAYAVWWINAWQASRGEDGDPSAAATAAVRGQVMRSMASDRSFAAAGDAAKQEMAESLLIQAVLLSGAVSQAKGQPEVMKAVSGAAVQGARGMGIDLSTMTLTDKGFVPGG